MDRFREIETFLAVVECKSFVGAAERLRISKSVVSRIIQQLENRIGGRLLQRTTRSLSLTDAGQQYYQRCRQIIDDLDEAEGDVETDSGKVSGLLRIFACHNFGGITWADNMERFLQLYPDVNLEMVWTDRNVDMISERFDIGFVISNKQEDSSLVTRKLASSEMVLVGSPEYLTRSGIPQSKDDLAQHNFIRYTKMDNLPTATGRFNGNTRLAVNRGGQCLNCALSGFGLAYLPKFAIRSHLFSGALVEVLPGHFTEETGVYIVYPSRKQLSGKVRAMIDFLVELFRDDKN